MANKSCSLLLDLYVDYIISAVGHKYTVWEQYLLRVYATNVNVCTPVLVILLIALNSYEAYILT